MSNKAYPFRPVVPSGGNSGPFHPPPTSIGPGMLLTEQAVTQYNNRLRPLWGNVDGLPDDISIAAALYKFGVVGNGINDDGPGLEEASQQENLILQLTPGHVYRVSQDVVLSGRVIGRGGIIRPDSGVTVTIAGSFEAGIYQCFDTSAGGSVVLTKVDRVLPQWFGAVGDGVADDTAAIQAAIRGMGPEGGVVSLGSSTYLVSSTLVVDRPRVGLQGDKSVLYWSRSASAESFVHFTSDRESASGVILDGSFSVHFGFNLTGGGFGGSVRDCEVTGVGRVGVRISNRHDTVVEGCRILDMGDPSLVSDGIVVHGTGHHGTTRTWIRNNRIERIGWMGEVTPSIDSDGIQVQGGGSQSVRSAVVDTWLVDNYIANATSRAIKVQESRTHVMGNICENAGSIRVVRESGAVVEKVTIAGNRMLWGSFSLGGSVLVDSIIENNIVETRPGTDVFRTSDGGIIRDSVIRGNIINAQSTGIVIGTDGCDNLIIEDNVIRTGLDGETTGTPSIGIYLLGVSEGIRVERNEIWAGRGATGGFPVRVNASVEARITDNKLRRLDDLSPHMMWLENPDNLFIRDNDGYVDRNSGQGIMPHNTTLVQVSHGLSRAPALRSVSITLNDTAGAATSFYVSSVGNNTITVRCDTNPGVDVPFSWAASVA